jgi:tetratricopeptide (TPR) repeat protein
MHEYAETVSEKNKGKTLQFPRVAFLCTLIKKEVIDKIGGLDERFTPGNFEDDDFCLRSQIAGFKTVIASDIFIHHYGSVSFKKNGENKYAKRLEINKQKFVDKWGGTPEEIWLQGKQYLKKEVRYPIDNDLFNQSIARAFINIDDEEYDFALENLNLALDSFDNSKRVGYENITKEEILNLIGTLLLSKNDLEEAKKYFEQELNENPNSSPACFGLGEVFYKAEMYEESKTMYEWAVVNNENNKNAQIRLQHVNTKLNLPPEHNTILVEANQGVE